MSARTFAEDLSARATAHPDEIALLTPEEPISYGELDRRASHLAWALRALGVERGDRVATVLPNGVAAAVAIYGILRAGAAFSPVNPTTKQERLAHLLADLGAAALVTDAAHDELAGAAAGAAGDVPVIADQKSLDTADAAAPAPPLEVDLAAVIYTSGSTGEPKGVTL